jgi:hypothetical protein
MFGSDDPQSRGSHRFWIIRRFADSACRKSGLEQFLALSATAIGTALILEVGVVGCTSAPVLRPSSTLPAAAFETPQRYLIVTLPNPVDTVPSRAASTPRGYDNVGGPYLAGSAARRASRAIAVSYRLREVSSWPIAVLSVNCIVYELPPDADLAQLLSALARDTRIKTAQPLFEFAAESNLWSNP